MKVRATSSGVYVPAGFFNLRTGNVYDVNRETGDLLVRAGLAEVVDAGPGASSPVDLGSQKPAKPAKGAKRLDAAPENKAD